MATAAQITANRANALNSTGPRTPEGKEASRLNALKHGIDAASIVIPGEDPAEYESLAANYYEEFEPGSAVEEFHVETLIRSDWQMRRLKRVEAKLYRALLAEGSTPEDIDVAILRDSPSAKLVRKVFAQIASLDRAFHRALKELRSSRREREQYETDLAIARLHAKRFQTAQPAETPKLGLFRESGTVPQPGPQNLDPILLRL